MELLYSRSLDQLLWRRRATFRETRLAIEAEAREHADVLWLPNATDAGVPTIKGYHWWRAAGRMLPPEGSARGLRIAAKVDDDSFMRPKEQDEASKQTTDVFVTALIIFPLALLVVGAAVFGAPAIFTFATDQVRPG